MVPRFTDIINGAESYDFAIILGGTNDLGEYRPDQTFGNLKKMYNLAREKLTVPFAVTLPEVKQESFIKWITERRTDVNSLVKEYCQASEISVVDLATLMPHLSLPPDQEKKIWDDSLHFTEYGYDQVGEIMYNAIRPFMDAFLPASTSEK